MGLPMSNLVEIVRIVEKLKFFVLRRHWGVAAIGVTIRGWLLIFVRKS